MAAFVAARVTGDVGSNRKKAFFSHSPLVVSVHANSVRDVVIDGCKPLCCSTEIPKTCFGGISSKVCVDEIKMNILVKLQIAVSQFQTLPSARLSVRGQIFVSAIVSQP